MNFIAFLEPPQNGDSILLVGLAHLHLLKTALQRGILLDKFAIFIQGGGTDTVQLTPSQSGLEHITGIHGPLCFTSPHHGVQLIDKQDNPPLLLRQLIQDILQALLKLSAELSTCQQRAQIQRQQTLILQAFGHLTIDNTLGQALNYRRLAHTRLADQYRIILSSALQDLNSAANFVIAANHRVEATRLGSSGQIDRIFL